MSVRHPRTIDEWRLHIAELEGEDLRSKALAANTARFVQALSREGWSGDDIRTIFVLLAKRFVDTSQAAPSAGFFDLAALGKE
jgi:hypothetical protein